MTPKALINEIPVAFVGTSFSWEIETGALPVFQDWITTIEIAEQVIKKYQGKEVTLTVGGIKAKRVIVLDMKPGPDTLTASIRFTDVRWYISKRWGASDLNVLRRTGDKRSSLVGGVPAELAQTADVVTYRPWSIQLTGTTHNLRSSIEHVLKNAYGSTDRAEEQGHLKFLTGTIPTTFVRRISLDDRLSDVIETILAQNPQVDMYVDLEGQIVFDDFTPGAEVDRFFSLGLLPYAGVSNFRLVVKKPVRPKKYRVFFTPEVEVRCDTHFSGVATTSADKPVPWIENVLPSVDISLAIPAGVRPARTVGAGSWLSIQNEAYA